MAKRRNFTDQPKDKVALEALRGDKNVQEIAAKHQLHPNQMSPSKAWPTGDHEYRSRGAVHGIDLDHDVDRG